MSAKLEPWITVAPDMSELRDVRASMVVQKTTVKAGASRPLPWQDGDAKPKLGAARYEIESPIGMGGFGLVFKARDTDLGRLVALKFLRAASDQNMRTLLWNEARVLAKLEHEAIVTIHEVGEAPEKAFLPPSWLEHGIEEQQFFMVMEFVLGEPLDSFLMRERFSVEQCLIIFQKMLDAVAHAHNHQILHRDLKPGNIMLRAEGGLVVIDFGLASLVGVLGAEGGSIVGSPAYMAPEQIQGEILDARTDVFALGVILFEMLAGKHPFPQRSGEHLGLYLQRRLSEDPPKLSCFTQEVSRHLCAIVEKAMTQSPSARYQSVGELEAELKEFFHRKECERRAEVCLAQAEKLGQGLIRIGQRLKQTTNEEQGLRESIPSFLPRGSKRKKRRALLARRLTYLGAIMALLKARYVAIITKALQEDPLCARAHELLQAFYREKFETVEDARESKRPLLHEEALEESRGLLREHDVKGSQGVFLKGDGRLTLVCDPSTDGVGAFLYRYEEHEGVLVPILSRGIICGDLPLDLPLVMGSYLVALRGHGVDVKYPVYISRGKHWQGVVSLTNARRVPRGFVLVPAGEYLAGGDPLSLERRERVTKVVQDFAIAQNPVIVGGYERYLNTLLAQGETKENVTARVPRINGPLWELRKNVWTLSSEGRALICKHQIPVPYARKYPMTCLTFSQVQAYCAWLRKTTGRFFSLPSQEEREKAAGGVDGRLFSWGDEEEPTFANCFDGVPPGHKKLGSVQEFPRDISVYGMRDCCGGVLEYTEDIPSDDPAKVAVCGGSWNQALISNNVRRITFSSTGDNFRSNVTGFRLVLRFG